MGSALTIARKELRALFQSQVALLFLAVFELGTLFAFFTLSRFFARNLADVRPLFEWLPLMLILLVSAISMRAWAEERNSGTLEVLLTLPVKTRDLVLGKFLAGMGLVAMALAFTLPLPLTVYLLGPLDIGPVIGGYVGALCMAAAYLAIGLCVSARTNNQVVALLVTGVLGGVLYLVGSSEVVDLLSGAPAEWARAIGTGSRFESIARGVVDLRDLVYYGSIAVFFLALNGYFLEKQRLQTGGDGVLAGAGFLGIGLAALGGAWYLVSTAETSPYWLIPGAVSVLGGGALIARGLAVGRESGASTSARLLSHQGWVVLAALNAIVLNLWLAPVTVARTDLTANKEYSVSSVTRGVLTKLDEPLLIDGYFTERSHPLLQPLMPQVRDLLKEYGVYGGGNVKVAFSDPTQDEALEELIGQEYGIRPEQFGVTDRNAQSVVNAYFHVLVRYGDQHAVLGFQDLIEVNFNGSDLDVKLRNLEYDVTKAIKKVSQDFTSTESLLGKLPAGSKLTLYLSPGSLPDAMQDTSGVMREVATDLAARSGGTLAFVETDPTTDPALAEQIATDYGVQPLAADIFAQQVFYMHLVLHAGDNVERLLPRGEVKKNDLEKSLEAAISRAVPGQLRTITVVTEQPQPPPPNPNMPPHMQPPPPRADYQALQQVVQQRFELAASDLSEGTVPQATDVLVLAKTGRLDDKQKLAIDQYLMRGGSIIALAGRANVTPGQSGLEAKAGDTSLIDLIGTYGVEVGQGLVFDPRNARFPVPRMEQRGNFRVQRVEMIPYGFFPDLRGDSLKAGHLALAGLNNLTVPWASPLTIASDLPEGMTAEVLLKSSDEAWVRDSLEIAPDLAVYPELGFPREGAARSDLAVALTGRFKSAFAGEEAKPSLGEFTQILEEGVAEGRIVVVGSGEITSDLMMSIAGGQGGEVHRNNLMLVNNLVDWSVADTDLLSIRSAGAFARTLDPMDPDQLWMIEMMNYGLVLLPLPLVFFVSRRRRRAPTPPPAVMQEVSA